MPAPCHLVALATDNDEKLNIRINNLLGMFLQDLGRSIREDMSCACKNAKNLVKWNVMEERSVTQPREDQTWEKCSDQVRSVAAARVPFGNLRISSTSISRFCSELYQILSSKSGNRLHMGSSGNFTLDEQVLNIVVEKKLRLFGSSLRFSI
ncbi:hypothetical protein SDJN02_06052, partial [Cucurbita argyrosperma subsp. argyrosperma]